MDYETKRVQFEKAACKKGYCLDVDSVGRYEDVFLQEAWEIFSLINLQPLLTGMS